jgi:hypothetical protein
MSNPKSSSGQSTTTPFECELERLLDGMTAALCELERHSETAAQAEVTCKVRYAQAVLASERKTVSEREHEATVLCENELFQRALAERLEKLAREKLMSYRSSMDAIRSLMVNARSF